MISESGSTYYILWNLVITNVVLRKRLSMEQIKEYEVGINPNNKLYFIDSNILLAMSQFYYKGKCDRGDEVTEDLKKFILKARMQGIQNQFAITEICYDYTCNAINSEQMNKIMIAYDNLIMNMSADEILVHKGAPAPQAKRNLPRNYTFKSIFDCKLPVFFLGDNVEMIGTFYEVYLYFLKIYSLCFEQIQPMQKIEKLFDFMTNEINIFLGYEFYLAVLLFLGQPKEREIAAGVFKPTQNPTLDHVLNAVIDIFQYRMACFIADFSVKMKMPMNPIFATMDKSLQNYIEHNVSYSTIMSTNMVTPVNHFRVSIKEAYVDAWDDFYYNRYYPCISSRYMELHTKEISDEKRKEILNIVYQNITKYETEIFS